MTEPIDIRLKIEADARAYLNKHGSAVSLYHALRYGCCGGSALLPAVEPGAPTDPTGWHIVDCDGVQVYIDRDMTLSTGATLRIGVDRLLGWHKLWIDTPPETD